MGKHHLLRRVTCRYQDFDPTPIPPIPRRDKGYKILLGHGRRVYMLRNSWGPRHHLLLRPRLGILEPFANRQVHQQARSLAYPFGYQYCHRCHHLPHTCADGSQVKHEHETEDRSYWRFLCRYHVSTPH